MIGLITSERIKVTSTRLWWVLGIVAVLMSVLLGTLPQFLLAKDGSLTDPDTLNGLWSTSGPTFLIPLIMGLIAMTGEYRHKTITDSFLLTPSRIHVLLAKTTVQAVYGVLLAIACTGIGVALVLLLIGGQNHASVDAAAVLEAFGGSMIAFALFAILGLAIGSLLVNQALAITLSLLWFLLVESVLQVTIRSISAIPDWLADPLPGVAGGAILGGSTSEGSDVAAPTLTAWQGALILIVWAVVLGFTAARTTLKRDIT